MDYEIPEDLPNVHIKCSFVNLEHITVRKYMIHGYAGSWYGTFIIKTNSYILQTGACKQNGYLIFYDSKDGCVWMKLDEDGNINKIICGVENRGVIIIDYIAKVIIHRDEKKNKLYVYVKLSQIKIESGAENIIMNLDLLNARPKYTPGQKFDLPYDYKGLLNNIINRDENYDLWEEYYSCIKKDKGDIKAIMESEIKDQEYGLCCICKTLRATYCLDKCHHLVYCGGCKEVSSLTCPICTVKNNSTMRIYIP